MLVRLPGAPWRGRDTEEGGRGWIDDADASAE